MIWLNENNVVKVWGVKADEKGRVSCRVSVREKDTEGNVSYTNWNASFSKGCAERALQLQDKDNIKITKGGVNAYLSKTRFDTNNKPVQVAYLQVVDFEKFEFESNTPANAANNSIAAQRNVVRSAVGAAPVQDNDKLPF